MPIADRIERSHHVGREPAGFFQHGVDPVRRVLRETGQVSSMLCFSPDFTHPEPAFRQILKDVRGLCFAA